MQPWITLATADVPGGGKLTLVQRGKHLVIRINGQELMANQMTRSEEMLATLALEPLEAEGLRKKPRVLIGGLGMGYTLRATLDRMPKDARVDVAELVPEVVEWNRGVLGPLAGHPLNDPRTRVLVGDVGKFIAEAENEYDSIMLDTDNGPVALTAPQNAALYGRDALRRMRRALVPGGTLAVWAAGEERAFEKRMVECGFRTRTIHPRGREGGKGTRFVVFLGQALDRR
jgi:spermidine synthase